MPELPEVQALAEFLTEHAVGCVVARVEVAAVRYSFSVKILTGSTLGLRPRPPRHRPAGTAVPWRACPTP